VSASSATRSRTCTLPVRPAPRHGDARADTRHHLCNRHGALSRSWVSCTGRESCSR
jgi:hypothetical protein